MEYVDYGVFTSSVNTLFIPKYARKAAGGRFSVCQSLQEKLPMAGSVGGWFSVYLNCHASQTSRRLDIRCLDTSEKTDYIDSAESNQSIYNTGNPCHVAQNKCHEIKSEESN